MTTDKTAGLGARLKLLRTRQRLTQKDLADKVGLERTSITNIERGYQKLSVEVLERMARAMGHRVEITFVELPATELEVEFGPITLRPR